MPELDVCFHDLAGPPPSGWDDYRRAARLTCAWDWALMRASGADGGPPRFAMTINDAGTLVGIAAARLPGVRLSPSALRGLSAERRTALGVLDVDCLLSSALSGVVVDGGADGYLAALTALRRATRARFGRRVAAILLRQVPEPLLATATRFPSVVLEAPPIGRHVLAYDSFDAYFSGLSRSRRNEFRQIERDADVVVTYTGRGDTRPERLDLDTMLALVNDTVLQHRAHRWSPIRLVGPTLLNAVAHHEDVELITYQDPAGDLLGYGLLLGGGSWPVSWVAGFRPHGPGVRSGLWFHRELLYTKRAIERGLPGYVSGARTDEAKIRLGHQMTPVWSVLHLLAGGDAPRFLPTERS